MQRRILLLGIVLLAASPATAATRCDFAYDDSVRRGMVEPALALYGKAEGAKQSLATHYDIQKPSVRPTGRDDGSLILTFDTTQPEIDGPTLRVVVDPCARRVLYVDERQDNLLVFPVNGAFKTDDATLKSALVGGWIVPPDKWLIKPSDPGADPDINLRIVQRFRADGTGLTEVYKDGACTVPDRSVAFTWGLSGGILTVWPAKDDPDAFFLIEPQAVGIALGEQPDRMALFSPAHKIEGILNRATRCGWPVNFQLQAY